MTSALRSILVCPIALLVLVVVAACGGGASWGRNEGAATISDPVYDACPIGQTDQAQGRYSDDCVDQVIPWHFKRLDLSKDYALLTREISNAANPGQLNSTYMPRDTNSALPQLTIVVSNGSAVVPAPLENLGDVKSVRGVLVEMRSDRSGPTSVRGAMWLDNGVWYVLIARGGGSADAVDAMLMTWAAELLTAE